VVLLSTVLAAAAEAGEAVAEETKNPILPELSEMFWAAIFFLALWALMKYVLLPPIVRTMNDRDAKVRDDHQAAERAEVERVTKLEQYEAGLAGARAEAVRLIEDGRAEGEAQRREAIAAAEAEVAGQRATAAEEIAAAKARARAELTGSLAEIAVGAAEAVVQKPIDRAAQQQVVEDYVNRSGAQN
jgi:F-type H+-transporting ATPase subunit b